jgi:hypothetical protein
MLGWWRRHRAEKKRRSALIEADALDLVRRFGDEAYYEARDRDREERRGGLIDANRPARHWSAVRMRIAGLTGKEVGLDTATRYLKK